MSDIFIPEIIPYLPVDLYPCVDSAASIVINGQRLDGFFLSHDSNDKLHLSLEFLCIFPKARRGFLDAESLSSLTSRNVEKLDLDGLFQLLNLIELNQKEVFPMKAILQKILYTQWAQSPQIMAKL